MKRLLGVEHSGGRAEYWWKEEDGGKKTITVETVEDAEPAVEENKALFNNAPQRFGNAPFHRVASVPFTVIEELCKLNKISFRELMDVRSDRAVKIWNTFINDPQMRAFRTRPGRIEMKQR